MSAASFVDPRTRPRPCSSRRVAGSRRIARTTTDPEDLAPLHQLCRERRLYEVEDWIRAGLPFQLAAGMSVKGRHLTSALGIGLQAQDHALVFLLFCNGYHLDLERDCPLDLALRVRRWDLVDLLLEWGADPHRVALTNLFDTYRLELFEHFAALGIDLTAGHELATALAQHPGNKPLFGFAKRYRVTHTSIQNELDMALAYHAGRDGSEKGVQLCLWAGADPHGRAPSLRYLEFADEEDPGTCAVEEACRAGHAAILKRLRPDPTQDDFAALYACAPNEAVGPAGEDCSADPRRSRDPLTGLLVAGSCLRRGTIGPRTRCTLSRGVAVARGGRRGDRRVASSAATHARRHVCRDAEVAGRGDHCTPAILQSLARTSSMRARFRAVGFLPTLRNGGWQQSRMRPSRSSEVLASYGVSEPKTKRLLPSVVEIGWHRRAERELRLTREELFDRVWSEPAERNAEAWGLSGRGLAKACERARIPVPSRGFWAKAQHGKAVRRPTLPSLHAGEVQWIVIHLPPDGRLFDASSGAS